MTFRKEIFADDSYAYNFTDRGQGLNHAAADATHYVDAIKSIQDQKMSLAEAIAAYDTEMIARGGEEVRVSRINTDMVRDWENLMESPMMKMGIEKS
jgi:hypothetical protein